MALAGGRASDIRGGVLALHGAACVVPLVSLFFFP